MFGSVGLGVPLISSGAKVYADSTSYSVNATSLNVRSSPSVTSQIIGVLKNNQSVSVIEHGSNGWYKIQYNNTVGYVSDKYIKQSTTVSSPVTPATSQVAYVVSGSTVNVRSGSGTNYSIIGQVTYNQSVVPIEMTSNGWYKIQYNNQVGYVSATYVQKVNLSQIQSQGVLMDVPIISQRPELPTGCEITAVTMMLQGAGANVNKIALAKEMPKSFNPNLGFMGDPFTTSGVTIYPPALMKLVAKYAGSAVDLTGCSNATLESKLREYKPVVAWVRIHGFNFHAICISGYDSVNYYYNDPWTGEKNAAISKTTFNSVWINRMAISY